MAQRIDKEKHLECMAETGATDLARLSGVIYSGANTILQTVTGDLSKEQKHVLRRGAISSIEAYTQHHFDEMEETGRINSKERKELESLAEKTMAAFEKTTSRTESDILRLDTAYRRFEDVTMNLAFKKYAKCMCP